MTDTSTPTRGRTRGAASLALWLTATRRTPGDIALILGAPADTVRRWLSGQRTPRPDMRERLARLAHVDPAEWERFDAVADLVDARRAIAEERERAAATSSNCSRGSARP